MLRNSWQRWLIEFLHHSLKTKQTDITLAHSKDMYSLCPKCLLNIYSYSWPLFKVQEAKEMKTQRQKYQASNVLVLVEFSFRGRWVRTVMGEIRQGHRAWPVYEKKRNVYKENEKWGLTSSISSTLSSKDPWCPPFLSGIWKENAFTKSPKTKFDVPQRLFFKAPQHCFVSMQCEGEEMSLKEGTWIYKTIFHPMACTRGKKP